MVKNDFYFYLVLFLGFINCTVLGFSLFLGSGEKNTHFGVLFFKNRKWREFEKKLKKIDDESMAIKSFSNYR
jgi:hypothetical protein